MVRSILVSYDICDYTRHWSFLMNLGGLSSSRFEFPGNLRNSLYAMQLHLNNKPVIWMCSPEFGKHRKRLRFDGAFIEKIKGDESERVL